jgi:hypothetical protein
MAWGSGENVSKLLSGFSGMKFQQTSRTAVGSMHVYEVRPRKDKRGFDLISDAFCRLSLRFYSFPLGRDQREIFKTLAVSWM